MEGLKKGILVRNGTAVGTLGDKYFSNAPIGVIQAYSGNTVPYGYLLADGTSYKVAYYPDLYAVIGNTYGGDTENFNVPTVQPPALTMVYIIKAFHTNEGVDSGVSDDVINYVNDSLVNKADKSYVDDNFATMDKVGTTQIIGFKTNLLNQCYGYYTIENNKVSVHMKFVLSRKLGDWEILTNENLLAPSSAVTKKANGKTGSSNSVYISTKGTMQQGGGGGMSAGIYEFDFEYTTA